MHLVDQRAHRRQAQAAGRQQHVLALECLEREPSPNGPRMPTIWPGCIACNASVTSPARRTHSSNVPLRRLGEELMLIGASPTPNTDSSTNWPGSWSSDRPPGSAIVYSFSRSVSVLTLTICAGVGR